MHGSHRGSSRHQRFSWVTALAVVAFGCLDRRAGFEPPPAGVVATVSVAPPTASVLVGSTVQLAGIPRDAAGNTLTDQSIAWTTSHPQRAQVSGTGLVNGLAVGAVTITASSGGKIGTAAVTVTQVPVVTVEVTPPSATLMVGATQTLVATTKDANGNALTGRPVTWASSDTTIARVSGTGVVTGVKVGTVSVTASCEGKSGSASVSVTPVPVATVQVSPATPAVAVGSTVQLAATVRDASGNVLTGRVVTWSTSDGSRAQVNSNGLVLGVAAGAATITAASEGQTGTVTVTVTLVPVTTVTVTPSPTSVQVGSTVQLTATTRDAGNNILTGRVVTWSTSDDLKAQVNGSGLVNGVAQGAVTITATSEGKTGTASVTVTGVATGGDTVFVDGFESGALGDAGRWHDILGDFAMVTASSEGITAPSGTRVMRVQPPGGAISHFVATGATSPYERLRLSYRLYRKAGYGSGGLRHGVIRGSKDQWASYGNAGRCPDDPNNAHQQEYVVVALNNAIVDNWQLRMYNYWLGQQKVQASPPVCYGTNGLGSGDVPQGIYHDQSFAPAENQWYRYEIEIQLNTPGQSDGWEKVWVDGVLKIEHRNVGYRSSALTRLWAITFDVGNTTVGTAYFDDVLVTVPSP